MKNHPGAALPPSNRNKEFDIPGLPNPTFSQAAGSIKTAPQGCQWCHKQYASKVSYSTLTNPFYRNNVIFAREVASINCSEFFILGFEFLSKKIAYRGGIYQFTEKS